MPEGLAAGIQVAHRRATILRALLAAMLVAIIVSLASAWSQNELLDGVLHGAPLTHEQASANDARQRLIALGRLLLLIGTVISWCRWQYRAYANLQLIGTRDTEYTPGASVGYWFIPLINLYRPYQITSEMYRRSEIQNGRDTIGGLSNPALVGVWWFAYLAWGAISNWSSVIARGATTVPTLISSTNIAMIAHLVGIVTTVLAVLVINSIDRFQQSFPITEQVPASPRP